MKNLPPFLATHSLREIWQASIIYSQATGDKTLENYLSQALKFAESLENPKSYSKCIICETRISKGKNYCSFDCAETDGAN